MAGLVLSGITAFPLQSELCWLVSALQTGVLQSVAAAVHLLPWIERVSDALAATNAAYPFLAYGTDWLAFAHLVIAAAFVGPYVDPVAQQVGHHVRPYRLCRRRPTGADCRRYPRNPARLAPYRCGLRIFGAIPLLVCRRSIGVLESGIGECRRIPMPLQDHDL